MKEATTIYLSEEGKKEKAYRVVLTFVSEEGKHYIVYTDDKKDEDGFIKTYAGVYATKNDKEVLVPIESDEDFDLIEGLLRKLEKEEK